MIALASEIGSPMEIARISWQRAGSSGAATGYYNSFKIYMGLSADDQLSDNFRDNYIEGSRTLVYSTASQQMSADPDQWMSIDLDQAFSYNGEDNLLVEIEWSGGSNMFYTWMWETGASRGLMNKSNIGSPTGTLYTRMSRLMFESASSLTPMTFAAIKTLW